MRRLRVLYDGTPLGGRWTTLAHLAGDPPPGEQGNYNRRIRLMGQPIRLSSGETILLDALARHTANIAFNTIEEAANSDIEWIRDHFRELVPFLSTIDGIIYIADSDPSQQSFDQYHSRDAVEKWRRAGVDMNRIPIVFQCNKRDILGARPMAEMAPFLATPRCAFVESVATTGYGLVQAIERLVELIDHGAPDTDHSRLEPAPEATEEAPAAEPISPAWLFDHHRPPRVLTSDGKLEATLEQSTLESEVVLNQGAMFSPAQDVVFDVPAMVPGRYAIDIVRRVVSLEEPSGRRIINRSTMATRFRLRGAKAVRHELLELRGLHMSMVIGDAGAVRAANHDNLRLVMDRARSELAVVASLRMSQFEPVSMGELAVFKMGSRLTWIGRDDSGGTVEIVWSPGLNIIRKEWV